MQSSGTVPMSEEALPQRPCNISQRFDQSSKLSDNDDGQDLSEGGTFTKVKTKTRDANCLEIPMKMRALLYTNDVICPVSLSVLNQKIPEN